MQKAPHMVALIGMCSAMIAVQKGRPQAAADIPI
jgi:hypothetical protein